MTDSFFKIHKEEVDFAGKTLVLETGHMARQADGAVLVTYGGTIVLCTAVGAKKANESADFFPLTVHYQEKAYASGRIPSGFVKREGKPSERETLTSRLIDRPIRPLFPDGFFNEVQIICTVLSHDKVNSPDVISIIGASAALAISGIPFSDTVCAARVGYKNNEFILNPTTEDLKRSKLDLVVAGTRDGVLMVESEAQQLSEDVMLEAVKFGHQSFAPVLDAIESLKKAVGKPLWQVPGADPKYGQIKESVKQSIEKDLNAAFEIKEKLERHNAIAAFKDALLEKTAEEDVALTKKALEELEYELLRSNVLDHSKRIDGRALDEVRPICCEVGVLPRAHGSALFTRGETQALVVTTLGSADDEQLVDSLLGDYKEHFLVHYNFPPYAVGEVGRMSSPGRREIGHGRLAWRSLHPLIPRSEEFPYTVRVVSEVTESNGSSSMATVCGTSLSLMDAGVPLKKPISGIAMGLVKEGDKFAVLTDIQGDEDHLGDMDFKVAGTEEGVTALQMDIKITSITFEIMKVALEQAQRGRIHIAEQMKLAIEQPRKELSQFAPQIMGVQIDKDKIRELIGPGGKVIREICDTTGTKIDIGEDGKVSVFGADQASLAKAMGMINDIVGEPEIGQIYTGPVVKITDFGAFVNYFGSRDGLVHISEISEGRIERVEDVLKEGDIVKVVLLGVDARTRKARLSIKAANGGGGGVSTGGGYGGGSGAPRRPRDDDSRGGGGGRRDDSRPPRRGDDDRRHNKPRW
ncbi:MAG: polyribonucleotide nucleotidyltransferase [Holosporales bacterium]|jgi:polyribonucleotide nucleotidyltransferase|nr:polyribonucleotide nucleotidyltransferase [Holosporales bacterium]